MDSRHLKKIFYYAAFFVQVYEVNSQWRGRIHPSVHNSETTEQISIKFDLEMCTTGYQASSTFCSYRYDVTPSTDRAQIKLYKFA